MQDMLLSLLPSSEQIQFISKGSTYVSPPSPGYIYECSLRHSGDPCCTKRGTCRTAVTYLAAALIFLIAASKSTAIAVVGGAYPFYGNVLKAGVPHSDLSFSLCTVRVF